MIQKQFMCAICYMYYAVYMHYAFHKKMFTNMRYAMYNGIFLSVTKIRTKYFYQTFTDCLSNWYTHFDILTCQMWLQVMASGILKNIIKITDVTINDDKGLFFISTLLL